MPNPFPLVVRLLVNIGLGDFPQTKPLAFTPDSPSWRTSPFKVNELLEILDAGSVTTKAVELPAVVKFKLFP